MCPKHLPQLVPKLDSAAAICLDPGGEDESTLAGKPPADALATGFLLAFLSDHEGHPQPFEDPVLATS